MRWFLAAGAVILPAKSGFPGVDRKAKGAVFFATGGEQGILKVWRSDTGQCVYRHRCRALHACCVHADFPGTSCLYHTANAQAAT